MKSFALGSIAIAAVLFSGAACRSSSAVATQEADEALGMSGDPGHEMPRAEPLSQHEWLHQLVGEWTATSGATVEPGAEPMMMESTESVRSIGGLWIVAEGSATMDGTPLTTIMTLGFDPRRQAFVGTWIDTMQANMWTYTGTLDEARKVLTLETEGPSFEDPSKTCRFRDAIELKDRDHRVLTSSIQGEDGTWTTFLRAEYRRKQP